MAQALVNRARNRGRGRGRHSNRSATRPLYSSGVDLLLECFDEDLSDAQKKCTADQNKAYLSAMKEINAAKKNNNSTVKYFDTHLTTEELDAYKVSVVQSLQSSQPTPAAVPVESTPSRRPQRKSALAAKTVIAMNEGDDDVIIVDPEPAKQRTGRSRSRGKGDKDQNYQIPGVARPIPQVGVNHLTPSPQTMVLGNSEKNQPIALPPGVTFSNLAQVLAPNGVSVQYMYQTQQGSVIRGPPPPVPTNVRPTLLPQQQPLVVPGTHGLGVKRLPGQADLSEPLPKKRQSKPTEKAAANKNAMRAVAMPQKPAQSKAPRKKDEDGNWVPLDEYYYSKQEGDPAYREEKGEFRFKCWYCHKMLYNNVRIMVHMQGHIDNDKQQHLDLSDLTQCKHCYKQFDTPFEMQNHVEKVHSGTANALVCRICEKDHETQASLRQHMKASHNTCEMPYICQLCNFRSSVYNDVVDHFKKRHDSSQFALCLYCLKVFKMSVSKSSGWALTSQYYQHIQKHQIKSTNKKCSCCKLTFLNKNEAKTHKQRDHLPNFRATISIPKADKAAGSLERVMVKVPTAEGEATSKKVKSLNAPVASKVQLLHNVRHNDILPSHVCYECKKPMTEADHYKKYVECSLCRYATTCSFSYSSHMLGFHSGAGGVRWKGVPRERPMPQPWYCLCGFNTNKGNKQAYHLVTCSKRTAYQKKPEQKFFEYDDEQEEFNPFEPYGDEGESQEQSSPEKEIPSLFGALGLVRKTETSSFNRKDNGSPKKPVDIAQSIIGEVLDKIFPGSLVAKKSTGGVPKSPGAASPRPSSQLDSEVIPPEFTGSRKWSTVKIQDEKRPSKDSVFLGDTQNAEESGTGDSREKAPSKDTLTGDPKPVAEKPKVSIFEKHSESEKDLNESNDLGQDVGDNTSDTLKTVSEKPDASLGENQSEKDRPESNDLGQDFSDNNLKSSEDTVTTVTESRSEIETEDESTQESNRDSFQAAEIANMDNDETCDAAGDTEELEEVMETESSQDAVSSAQKLAEETSESISNESEILHKVSDQNEDQGEAEEDIHTISGTVPMETEDITQENEPEQAGESPTNTMERDPPGVESLEAMEESNAAEESAKEEVKQRGVMEESAILETESSCVAAESTIENSADAPIETSVCDKEIDGSGGEDDCINEMEYVQTGEAKEELATKAISNVVEIEESDTEESDLIQDDIGEQASEAGDSSAESKETEEAVTEETTGSAGEAVTEETTGSAGEAVTEETTGSAGEAVTEDTTESSQNQGRNQLQSESAAEPGRSQDGTKTDEAGCETSDVSVSAAYKGAASEILDAQSQHSDIVGNELSQIPSISVPSLNKGQDKISSSVSKDNREDKQLPKGASAISESTTFKPSHEKSPSIVNREQVKQSVEPLDSKSSSEGPDKHVDNQSSSQGSGHMYKSPSSASSNQRHESKHDKSSSSRDGSYDRRDNRHDGRHDSHDYRKHDSRDRYGESRWDDRHGGHHRDGHRDDYRSRDNRYGGNSGGGGYNRDRYGSGGGGYQHNRQDNRNNYNQRGGSGGYYRNDNNYNKRGWGRGSGHHGGGGGYHGYY